MQQVAELGVSNPSFFRGIFTAPCGQYGQTQQLLFGGITGLRGRRVVPALYCASSGPVTFPGKAGKAMVKQMRSIGGKDARADFSAGSSMALGASLPENYSVSEPQKVSRNSLREWTEADVLHRLKQGFVKFKEDRFLKEIDLFSQLAEGQEPKVMVIACADSRVCPTMLMGLGPGEVFTVRNVANLVPPCERDRISFHGTSAALEFAVTGLKVEHIIVIGHRNCGGIRALMSRETSEIESDFIGRWMSCALPAKRHTLVQMEGRSFLDQCKYCEQESINGSLANLLTFPWIKESFEAGKLGLHGWYYDFVEGELTSWDVQHPSMESQEPSLSTRILS